MSLFAVHIGDGVLWWPWSAAGFLAAAALYWLGARKIRDEEIPRIALLTAVFFIASTIHVKVPPSSIHLLGNGLVGVLLGWRAALAIPVGLLLQALLLGHGGFSSLGVNACVQIMPALAAWLLFHGLHHLAWTRRSWGRALLMGVGGLVAILGPIYGIALATTNLLADVNAMDFTWPNSLTFHPLTLAAAAAAMTVLVWAERRMENAPEFPLGLLVGEVTVMATAALNCLALLAGGETADRAGPPLALLALHLPLAVVEGIILGVTVGFLRRVKPEMLGSAGVHLRIVPIPQAAAASRTDAASERSSPRGAHRG